MASAKPFDMIPETQKKDRFPGKRPFAWITLAVLLTYFPTLLFGFSPLDEVWIFLDDLNRYTHLSNLPSLFTEPVVGSYYRPMCTSSFMVDATMGNGAAWIFHFSNMLIHLVCCFLFFKLLQGFGVGRKTAFIAALIFSVHTINVHAVAWIPGRNDSLLGLFIFGAFLSVLRFHREQKILWAIVSVFLLTGALFTKETAVVLPVLLFFFILHFAEKEKRMSFAILFISWSLVTAGWFLLRHHIVPAYPGLHNIDMGILAWDASCGLLMQVGKFLLPVQQSVLPKVEETYVWIFALIVVGALILILRTNISNKKNAWFGLEWFALLIGIPLLFGSVNGHGEHYEHRMYVPAFGLYLFIIQLRLRDTSIFQKANIQRTVLSLFLLFLMVNTWMRSRVYENAYTYSAAGIAESPGTPLFYNLLGEWYANNRQFDKALECFDTYIKMYPRKGIVYYSRANVYISLHETKKALLDFQRAVALEPDRPDFLLGRARTYMLAGMLDSAKADFEILLSKGANVPKEILADFQQHYQKEISSKDIDLFTKAIGSDTATAYSWNKRGMAYFSAGMYAQALADFRKAISKDAKQLDYLFNRGVVYESTGKIDSAYYDFRNCYDRGYVIDKNALDQMKLKVDSVLARKNQKE